MRFHRIQAVLCFAASIPISSVIAQHSGTGLSRPVERIASDYLRAYQSRYPELDVQPSSLFDNSQSAYAAWSLRERLYLRSVNRLASLAKAGSADAMMLGVLREKLEASLQFGICRRELWNVSPVTGWFGEYRGYAAQQETGSYQTRRIALARWSRLPKFIDTEIVNLRYGMEHGYRAPRVLVIATLAQLAPVVQLPAEQSPFFAPAKTDTSVEFREAFDSLVRQGVTPALRRYQDFLANEYLAKARSSIGVSANQDGNACFRALIRRYTSLRIGPEQLDSSGRDLLRSGREIDAVSVASMHRRFVADTANTFRNAEEILATARRVLERASAVAPRWFATLPTGPLPLVDSMPGADDSDPTAQYVPARRVGGQSWIYVNVQSLLKPGSRLYLERVMLHEGVPGHHVQLALQRAAAVHPLNRVLFNTAFAEGWAVYASNLADEMGLYSSTVTRLPLIESRIEDGVTLVVQSGIHAHGWSRSQAIDTVLAYSASSRSEAEQQVDYFIGAPAHALAYPIGAREFQLLRQHEQSRLGARFDIRRFHDVILRAGPLPFPVLAEVLRSNSIEGLPTTAFMSR